MDDEMIRFLYAMDKTKRLYCLRIMESIVFFVFLFFLTISYNTFFEVDPPITLNAPDKIIATHVDIENDIHQLILTRNIHVVYPYKAKIQTELTLQGTDLHVQLQEVTIEVKKVEDFKIRRIYFIDHIPQGNWCMTSTLFWKPSLSVLDHSFQLPTTCFDIP